MGKTGLAFILAAICCGVGYAGSETTNRVFDCGVNAVYLVRRIKGMEADLEEISRNLERDPINGSSIHNLETYLHGAGIRTDARKMRLASLCKKPGTLAILLTHGESGAGHFVVARVLAGQQLQIVDSLFGSSINKNAQTSKESLPVILIDPQGNNWVWRLYALASLSLLVWLGKRLRTQCNEQ